MATKKATSKPAAEAPKPTQRAAKKAAPRLQRGSVEQRLATIETVLNRVLAKLATHGMAISDEPEDQDDETDEPETGEPAEG